MMTGEDKSTTEEIFEKHRAAIDSYLNSLGLSTVSGFNEDVKHALSLTPQLLRNMCAEDCGEYAYTLANYALFIQQETNHHSSKLAWATQNLEVCIGNIAQNYGGQYAKYEERKALAIKDNSYASALNKMVIESQTRVKELEFLAGKIAAISKVLLDLQQSKRHAK